MRSFRAIAVLAALAAYPGTRADEQPAPQQPPPPSEWQQTPSQPDAAQPGIEATPSEPQTTAPTAPAPAGQWVYTQQYGWIWMPYGPAYTYVPPGGYDYPYTYAFAVGIGWSWFAAPWVFGWGPWPWFGGAGPFAYPWYGWGYWRYPRPFPGRPLPPPYRGFRPAGAPLYSGYRAGAPVGAYRPGMPPQYTPAMPHAAAPAMRAPAYRGHR
jgi:hypothetical protein